MRRLLTFALVVFLLSGLAAAQESQPRSHSQPNIIVILADDLGWGDVGWHESDIPTPNLDQLASEGTRLEQFYVQPVCTPTRAAFLTGRYPIRHGLQTGVVRPWAQYGLPLEEQTLPEGLRSAGYATAIVGKWHLGHFDPAYLPTKRGFDHQYGHYNGAIDYYEHSRDGGFDWHKDDQVHREEGYSTNLIAKEAARLIGEYAHKKPLFLYVPFNAVHSPHQAPERYQEGFGNLTGLRKVYAGMLAALDEGVGEIVGAVERAGIRDNTIFIFSSDNGGPQPGVVTSNGPLRAGKGTHYEGGVRVPAFVTWDGTIPAGSVVNAPLHIADLYPTLLRVAGANIEQKLPLDGYDVWETISEGKDSARKEVLINATPYSGALRVGDWKIVVNGGRASAGFDGEAVLESGETKLELFDLSKDPYETTDLSASNPEIAKRLLARWNEYREQAVPPKTHPKPAGFESPKIWGESKRKPNIVVILADDLGYGSVGAYGAPDSLVQTPNVDRLAKEGKRFTNAYTGSSVCSPTRYGLLTGRYAFRTNLQRGVLTPFAPLHIEPDRVTLASFLKAKGYTTAAVGKWHLGYGKALSSDGRTDYRTKLAPGPLEIGFDYHFGVPSNHGDLTGVFVENHYVYGLRSGKIEEGVVIAAPDPNDNRFASRYSRPDGLANRPQPVEVDAPRRKDDQVMSVLTEKAATWIRAQSAEKPFFLYFTPVAIHNPITPSPEVAGSSQAGSYGDWIHELDLSIGEILKSLDETGLAENTIVLFTSDNGGVYRPFNRDIEQTKSLEAGLKPNGDLRGGKHTIFEGGFRVPYIVRWPNKVQPGAVSHEVIGLVDSFATFAGIVGETLPTSPQSAPDSYDLSTAWINNSDNLNIRRDIIVHSADGVYAIRKGDWKWIEGIPAPGRNADSIHREDNFRPQLYDLKSDPAESIDLSAEHPEVVEELRTLLQLYRDSGYSRELPTVEQIAEASAIPALVFPMEALPTDPWKLVRGKWEIVDGNLLGSPQARQPAALSVELSKNESLRIRYEVQLRNVRRQTVRIDTELGRSHRFDVTNSGIQIVKNAGGPRSGDPQEVWEQADEKLDTDTWYPVEIQLAHNKGVFVVGDLKVESERPLIGQPRSAATWVIVGGTSGIRNVSIEQIP